MSGYKPEYVPMFSHTHYNDHYVKPPMEKSNHDQARELYHRNFSTPCDGFRCFSRNPEWRGCIEHEYVYEPMRFIDERRVIPTSISEFHRQRMSVPGHPKYKLPQEIPQSRTWELYSIPKVLKYQPDLEDKFRHDRMIGLEDEYEARVRNYTLRYRRKKYEVPDQDSEDDAEDKHVKFPKIYKGCQ